MTRLLGPAEIRDLAELLDLQPTKRLGQNFVIDGNTVRRIVSIAGVEDGDSVVEIGPGLGSLTLGLLATGASVLAIEIDRRLAEQLPKTVEQLQPGAPLTVLTADAMTIAELPGEPHTLVANLPYNVSVPVLLHFLERFESLRSGLVMVQAEVAHRLAAGPGSRTYGIPSLKAAWWADVQLAGNIGRSVFWPAPNVDSALVSLTRRDPPAAPELRERTFALVDAAFAQRRKMLRAALASTFGSSGEAETALIAAGIDPTLRGEQLAIGDFARLAESSPE
jgi:16S rRNA (adenine1518-N6/adenine1519-N6)-dimethyltransferase